MIRVLLADDENLIRTALASLLAIQDDLEVVAQAASGDEALAMARLAPPGRGRAGSADARPGRDRRRREAGH